MKGFYYVNQDNYYLCNLNAPNSKERETYLYSDSATSCIIAILKGYNSTGEPIVCITHLSCENRIAGFFSLMDSYFSGPVSLHAQGANPPEEIPSRENKALFESYTSRYSQPGRGPWYIEEHNLALGAGNPREKNRGCLGIDLKTGSVANTPFTLTPADRDPTKGLQNLYAIFGLELFPDPAPRNARLPFDDEEANILISTAFDNNWNILTYLSDEEILNYCSTTPDFEPPWFTETLRMSARLVEKLTKPGK